MKVNCRSQSSRGITLLELTVVIVVMLSLISIIFVGARSWKKGSDRSGCIMNIRNAQQAVRSHQNLRALPVGYPINMFTDILGPGNYIERDVTCPAGGDYDHIGYIPDQGEMAMWCSLATDDEHVPANTSDW